MPPVGLQQLAPDNVPDGPCRMLPNAEVAKGCSMDKPTPMQRIQHLKAALPAESPMPPQDIPPCAQCRDSGGNIRRGRRNGQLRTRVRRGPNDVALRPLRCPSCGIPPGNPAVRPAPDISGRCRACGTAHVLQNPSAAAAPGEPDRLARAARALREQPFPGVGEDMKNALRRAGIPAEKTPRDRLARP